MIRTGGLRWPARPMSSLGGNLSCDLGMGARDWIVDISIAEERRACFSNFQDPLGPRNRRKHIFSVSQNRLSIESRCKL